jgi:inner membrane protein
MDNLTHSLTGVVLSRAGLNRVVPQAGWLLVAASSAPDVDIAWGLRGSLAYLEHHRGWTHAFFYAPVVALIPLALWWLLMRLHRPGARLLLTGWGVATAGVLGHDLMDWLNVYGVRLLLPFRPDWYRLDLLHIVDVWVWVVLLVAAGGPLLARLVYSEIGARGATGRGMAWFAIVLLAGYGGLRAWAHGRAVATLESRIYLGETPRRAAAVPRPAQPLVWTGLVETDRSLRVVEVDLTREFDPESGREFLKPADQGPLKAARATPAVEGFLRFSRWPLWRVLPAPGGGVLVRLSDLRFGMPEDGRFVTEVLLDGQGRVVRQSFAFGTPRREAP